MPGCEEKAAPRIERLLPHSLLLVCPCQLHLRGLESAIQFKRLLIVKDGGIVIASIVIHPAAVRNDDQGERIERLCLAQLVARLIEATSRGQEHTIPMVCGGIVGVEVQSLVKLRFRLRILPLVTPQVESKRG